MKTRILTWAASTTLTGMLSQHAEASELPDFITGLSAPTIAVISNGDFVAESYASGRLAHACSKGSAGCRCLTGRITSMWPNRPASVKIPFPWRRRITGPANTGMAPCRKSGRSATVAAFPRTARRGDVRKGEASSAGLPFRAFQRICKCILAVAPTVLNEFLDQNSKIQHEISPLSQSSDVTGTPSGRLLNFARTQ